MAENNLHCSADVGFCRYAGHSGSIELTWDGNTVVDITCGFGDPRTCGHSELCELYNRRPIGFVQTYPKSPDK